MCSHEAEWAVGIAESQCLDENEGDDDRQEPGVSAIGFRFVPSLAACTSRGAARTTAATRGSCDRVRRAAATGSTSSGRSGSAARASEVSSRVTHGALRRTPNPITSTVSCQVCQDHHAFDSSRQRLPILSSMSDVTSVLFGTPASIQIGEVCLACGLRSSGSIAPVNCDGQLDLLQVGSTVGARPKIGFEAASVATRERPFEVVGDEFHRLLAHDVFPPSDSMSQPFRNLASRISGANLSYGLRCNRIR